MQTLSTMHYGRSAERQSARDWLPALWQEPLREDLDQAIDSMQSRVSGKVVMRLYKGSIMPVSRESDFSLHSIEQITFEDKDTDQNEVEGMIKYHGLQAANYQKLNR